METIIEKTTSMKWYIVRAQSNRERSVSEKLLKEAEKGDLIGKVGQVVVPMEKSFFLKDGKKVSREKVLYPGYIFVETNAIGELKYFIRGCNGATGFLTNRSGDIIPLQKSEIDRMLGQQEQAKELEIMETYIIGEEVKILDGPFSSMIGTIESLSGQKVTLVVSIFGRKNPLVLDLTQIDKHIS
jgi:transcriptional antiterminator NusG